MNGKRSYMLQQLKILLFFVSIFLMSCEDKQQLVDSVNKTWQMEWKRCGLYYNQYGGALNFTFNDIVQRGWYLQTGIDTVQFDIVSVTNEKIILDNLSSDDFASELLIESFGANVLEFETNNSKCDNEFFRFE